MKHLFININKMQLFLDLQNHTFLDNSSNSLKKGKL